jgi:predicted transposase YdaD
LPPREREREEEGRKEGRKEGKPENYFTSSDLHHGISRHIFGHIF